MSTNRGSVVGAEAAAGSAAGRSPPNSPPNRKNRQGSHRSFHTMQSHNQLTTPSGKFRDEILTLGNHQFGSNHRKGTSENCFSEPG